MRSSSSEARRGARALRLVAVGAVLAAALAAPWVLRTSAVMTDRSTFTLTVTVAPGPSGTTEEPAPGPTGTPPADPVADPAPTGVADRGDGLVRGARRGAAPLPGPPGEEPRG